MIIRSINLLKNSSLSVRINAVNYARRNYQLTSTKASEANQDRVKLKSLKDVPGPKEYPIIGSILEFKKRKKKMHLWCMELQQTYGDVVRINLLGHDMIYLFNPEYTKKMYGSDGLSPEQFGVQNIVWYRNVRRKERYPDGNAGVIGSFLDIWREQRTAVNPDMMRKSSALHYVEALDGIASECVDRIAETRDEKNEIRNAIPSIIHNFTLEGMGKIFFDVRMGALDPGEMNPECAQFIAMTRQMHETVFDMSTFWKYFDTPTYKKFDEASSFLYDASSVHVKAAIKRIKENKEDEDKPRSQWSILHKMMDKFGEDSTIPIVMSMDSVLAGVVSTAFTTSFLLYHLAANPVKQELAFEEVDRLFQGGKLTPETMSKLRYVTACMAESQRIAPQATATVRKLQSDISVGGYLIPKGSYVLQYGYVNGHNPKYFPDPERFLPERWLRGHPDQNDAPPFAHIPFGFGPRSCVGKRFAQMEVQTMAVKMLQRFRMEYHHEPVGMYLDFVSVADRDMRIKLFERS